MSLPRSSLAIALGLLVLAGAASAQGPSATTVVSVSLSGSMTQGTQEQTTVGANLGLSHDAGLTPDQLRRQLRFRADASYNTAKKPGQERVTSAEVYYGELRASADAQQFLSLFRGGVAPRVGATRTWLYGVASAYHHLAFGLDWEHAYGVGVFHDFTAPDAARSFGAGVDLRHIRETFDGQEPFSSWAVRLHETSIIPLTSKIDGPRFVQALEVTPAFEDSDALQGRAHVELRVPLVRGFTVSLTGGADYMKNAIPSAETTYWKTSVTITYDFAK